LLAGAAAACAAFVVICKLLLNKLDLLTGREGDSGDRCLPWLGIAQMVARRRCSPKAN
jgi:hypothetical protein